MMQTYLAERYGEEAFLNLPLEKVEKLCLIGKQCHKNEHGFVTYSLKGDAVILHDGFVKTESRGCLEAQKLMAAVFTIGRLAFKRVAISFSEIAGKNHILGLKAMKRAGFVLAQKTHEKFIFMKGI